MTTTGHTVLPLAPSAGSCCSTSQVAPEASVAEGTTTVPAAQGSSCCSSAG